MSKSGYNSEVTNGAETLQEPLVAYASSSSVKHLEALFADTLVAPSLIDEGIAFETFDQLRSLFPYLDEEWAHLLDISKRSLSRYEKDQSTFGRSHSEKILQIVELSALGLDLFGTSERYRLWLDTPCLALGSRTPMSLLSNVFGQRLVLRELAQIDAGIFV